VEDVLSGVATLRYVVGQTDGNHTSQTRHGAHLISPISAFRALKANGSDRNDPIRKSEGTRR
jgi:hypothetical protein